MRVLLIRQLKHSKRRKKNPINSLGEYVKSLYSTVVPQVGPSLTVSESLFIM